MLQREIKIKWSKSGRRSCDSRKPISPRGRFRVLAVGTCLNCVKSRDGLICLMCKNDAAAGISKSGGVRRVFRPDGAQRDGGQRRPITESSSENLTFHSSFQAVQGIYFCKHTVNLDAPGRKKCNWIVNRFFYCDAFLSEEIFFFHVLHTLAAETNRKAACWCLLCSLKK